MKPPNDPFVKLTPAELAAIVKARRPDRPRDNPPQSQDFPLPSTGRLWYVAEFIHQARLAKRREDATAETDWRDRAQSIASEIAREANADLLRSIADALDGKHADEPRETAQQRVLSAVNEFCGEHGKMPSRKDLVERGVRGEDISEIAPQDRRQAAMIRLRRQGGQGRKPRN